MSRSRSGDLRAGSSGRSLSARKTEIKDNSGVFTYKVAVTNPGTYEVSFSDPKGFIGIKKFTVAEPPTPEPTTVPTTIPTTTRPPTTFPTPLPTTTQSPLSPLLVIGALGMAGLLTAAVMKKY